MREVERAESELLASSKLQPHRVSPQQVARHQASHPFNRGAQSLRRGGAPGVWSLASSWPQRCNNVGSADGAEAVAAIGRELVVALRAKVEIALNVCAAGRAAGNLRLAQQKIQHGADAGRHDEADEHPEPRCSWRGAAHLC